MTHEVLSQKHVTEEQRNGQLEDRHSESDLEEAIFLEPLSTVHSIILDWTSASFIDSVGAKAIKQVLPFFTLVIFSISGLLQSVHVNSLVSLVPQRQFRDACMLRPDVQDSTSVSKSLSVSAGY